MPICTGEDIYLKEGFEPLLRSGGLSVIHPDLLTSGASSRPRRSGTWRRTTASPWPSIWPKVQSPHGRGTCRDRDRKLHGARIPLRRCRLVGRYRHRPSQAARQDGFITVPTSLAWDRRRRRRGDLAASRSRVSRASGSPRTTGTTSIPGIALGAEAKRTEVKIIDLAAPLSAGTPLSASSPTKASMAWAKSSSPRPISSPWVLYFREALIGEDPTDVERVMLQIRQRGSFKPYGAAVSAIEHALWTSPARRRAFRYKLLGGKVRDKVRVYNGSIRQKAHRRPTGGLRRRRQMDDGAAAELLHGQQESRSLQHEGHHRGLPLRHGAEEAAITAPWIRGDQRARFQSHARLRHRDEGSAGRQGRPGARLRPGLDAARCDQVARAVEKYNLCGSRTC